MPGFKGGFLLSNSDQKKVVKKTRFTPTDTEPILTNAMAKEKARSIVTSFFVSVAPTFIDAGLWHGDVKDYAGVDLLEIAGID